MYYLVHLSDAGRDDLEDYEAYQDFLNMEFKVRWTHVKDNSVGYEYIHEETGLKFYEGELIIIAELD